MPRIILKHKSPEYADKEEEHNLHICEMPGCTLDAEHKAPKHRGLNEYYRFCFEHVREYNRAWDFFSGMSESEVQNHMINSLYGDRPTWKYGVDGSPEDLLYKKAHQTYHYGEENHDQNEKKHTIQGNTPEAEALATMGLAPPLTLEAIKVRYKTLAKKYHPDLNADNPDAEELLKKVNMAYTILKVAYEDFEKLPDRDV